MQLKPLKGFKAFDQTMRQGKKFYHPRLIAFVAFRQTEASPAEVSDTAQNDTMYYGVTSRRGTRPAVLRNRIKRLLRESLRHIVLMESSTSADANAWPITSVVVIWTAIPAKASLLHLHDVQPPLHSVLKKAVHYFRSQLQTS